MFDRIKSLRDLLNLFKDLSPIISSLNELFTQFVNSTTTKEKIATLLLAMKEVAKLTPSSSDDQIIQNLEDFSQSAIFQFIVEKVEEFLNRPRFVDGQPDLLTRNQLEYDIMHSLISSDENSRTLTMAMSDEINAKSIPLAVIIQLVIELIKFIQNNRNHNQ